MPHFIQGGDTAELVLAAKFNLVAHPPGYPLWLNFSGIWLKLLGLFPFTNYFWQVTLLTSLFCLSTLFLLVNLLEKNRLIMALCLISLGFSSAFFEAALLPDVFSLHACLIALILFSYLKENLTYRDFYIPFIFAISLAHHHTIIFILPLIIFHFLECKAKASTKMFLSGLLLGLFITILFYLSLLLRDTTNYFSWGEINSLPSLWGHILRFDYGILRFAPQKTADQSSIFSALLYYFKSSMWEFSLLIMAGLMGFFSGTKEKSVYKKTFVLLITYFFSLTFFLLTNFKMEGMGLEIIKRFFVMPNIILVFVFASIFLINNKNEKSNFLTHASLISSLIFSLYIGGKNLYLNHQMSFDSTIRDYAEDLLLLGRLNGAKVVESRNDNSYFAMRYLAALDNDFFKEMAIISPTLLTHSWYREKLKKRLPIIKIANQKRMEEHSHIDIEADLIAPNIEQFNYLYASKERYLSLTYSTTILPLGKIVTLNSDKNKIYRPNLFTKKRSIHLLNQNSIQGFSKRLLNADYAHYFLDKGMNAYKEGDTFMAINWWKKAINIDPFSLPAYKNICQVDHEHSYCSKENLAQIAHEAQFIY